MNLNLYNTCARIYLCVTLAISRMILICMIALLGQAYKRFTYVIHARQTTKSSIKLALLVLLLIKHLQNIPVNQMGKNLGTYKIQHYADSPEKNNGECKNPNDRKKQAQPKNHRHLISFSSFPVTATLFLCF